MPCGGGAGTSQTGLDDPGAHWDGFRASRELGKHNPDSKKPCSSMTQMGPPASTRPGVPNRRQPHTIVHRGGPSAHRCFTWLWWQECKRSPVSPYLAVPDNRYRLTPPTRASAGHPAWGAVAADQPGDAGPVGQLAHGERHAHVGSLVRCRCNLAGCGCMCMGTWGLGQYGSTRGTLGLTATS